MTARKAAAAALVCALSFAQAAPLSAFAHEVDQFTARGTVELPEVEEIADREMNRLLDGAAQASGPGCSTRELGHQVHRKLIGLPGIRNKTMPNYQMTLERDQDIIRHAVPYGDSIFEITRRQAIRRPSIARLRIWYKLWGIKPVIRLGGVELGTDKIGHFLHAGWQYNNYFEKLVKRGKSTSEAERKVLKFGHFLERTLFGMGATAVKSWADLTANYQGFRFYQDLFSVGPNAYFKCEEGSWARIRDFHWREHVSPMWDEAINCSTFHKRVDGLFKKHIAALGMSCPVQPETCRRYIDTPHAEDLIGPECRGVGPAVIADPTITDSTTTDSTDGSGEGSAPSNEELAEALPGAELEEAPAAVSASETIIEE